METLQSINSIRVTGRVVTKNYEPESKHLFFVIGTATPKPRSEEYILDSPSFVVDGDDAEKINDVLEHTLRASVVGHIETSTAFRYEGSGTYKQTWDTAAYAEMVFPDQGTASENGVTIAGRIIRVYRNASAGKRFYLITVSTRTRSDEKKNLSFTYFDSGMRLEPQIGDFIYANGHIQTREINEERLADMNGRRRKKRFAMSVIAKSVSIVRRHKTIDNRNNMQNERNMNSMETTEGTPREERTYTETNSESAPAAASYGAVFPDGTKLDDENADVFSLNPEEDNSENMKTHETKGTESSMENADGSYQEETEKTEEEDFL